MTLRWVTRYVTVLLIKSVIPSNLTKTASKSTVCAVDGSALLV